MNFSPSWRTRPGRLAGLLVVVGSLQAAAPPWLLDDARAAAGPARPAEEGAVLLRSENVITVANDGGWQQRLRHAVHIVEPNGVPQARMRVPFVLGADQVLNAEAWLVRDGRLVKSYPRREWLDGVDVDGATLYSDFRTLTAFSPVAARGDSFGGEVLVRHANPIGQELIGFSPPLPARVQRLEVRVPKGWTANLVWLDSQGPEPVVAADRTSWVWEVRDQPADKTEIWAAERGRLRAALTVIPPAGSRRPAGLVPATWNAVATAMYDLQHPQCDGGAALAEVARRLTAGIDDPWKKIQAITAFVQNRRYIAVNRNDGLGFGYRPRKATEVLAADYGDCKDKTNLLQALLREAGFRAHLVAAYFGDPEAVRPEWPSPLQFNHAIAAIELPPGVEAPGAVADPVFGRLLFFDPTARWIPVGHLPWELQGGRGLLCDPHATGLLEFPRSAAEDELKTATRVNLRVDAAGAGQAELVENYHGQLAAAARAEGSSISDDQRMKYWTRRLNATINGATVDGIEGGAAASLWMYAVTVSFHTRRLAQPVGPGMLLLNLDIIPPASIPVLPDLPRQHDLLVRPIQMECEIRVEVPQGGRPEKPAPREIRSAYGNYDGRYELAAEKITYRRKLVLHPGRVRPDRYPEFRQFLKDVATAERTAIIIHLPAD